VTRLSRATAKDLRPVGHRLRRVALVVAGALAIAALIALFWRVQRLAGLDRSVDAAIWVSAQTHVRTVVCTAIDSSHEACTATDSRGSQWRRIVVYNGHAWNFG